MKSLEINTFRFKALSHEKIQHPPDIKFVFLLLCQ